MSGVSVRVEVDLEDVLSSLTDDDLESNGLCRLGDASHLHLVIDQQGRTLLTPILMPGMQKIAVLDKRGAGRGNE